MKLAYHSFIHLKRIVQNRTKTKINQVHWLLIDDIDEEEEGAT